MTYFWTRAEQFVQSMQVGFLFERRALRFGLGNAAGQATGMSRI